MVVGNVVVKVIYQAAVQYTGMISEEQRCQTPFEFRPGFARPVAVWFQVPPLVSRLWYARRNLGMRRTAGKPNSEPFIFSLFLIRIKCQPGM